MSRTTTGRCPMCGGALRTARTFGGRVAQRRVALGWTQERLAKRVGIGRVQVCNIELDRNMTDMRRLPKLAKVLGVTLDWLLAGAGEGPGHGRG